MSVIQLYFLFVAGILLSIILPIAKKWITEARDTTRHGAGDVVKQVLDFAIPYLKVAAGSAVLGFVLVLIYFNSGADAKGTTWFGAVLYGYAWDSTLQKLAQ